MTAHVIQRFPEEVGHGSQRLLKLAQWNPCIAPFRMKPSYGITQAGQLQHNKHNKVLLRHFLVVARHELILCSISMCISNITLEVAFKGSIDHLEHTTLYCRFSYHDIKSRTHHILVLLTCWLFPCQLTGFLMILLSPYKQQHKHCKHCILCKPL